MAKYKVDLFDYFSASYSEGQWSTLINKNANVAYIVDDFAKHQSIEDDIGRLSSANDSNRSPVQTRMSMFQNYLKHLSENYSERDKLQQFKEKTNYLVTTRNILLNLIAKDETRWVRLKVQYLKGKFYVAEEDIGDRDKDQNSGTRQVEDAIKKRTTKQQNQDPENSENSFFVIFDCKLRSLNILFYGNVKIAQSHEEKISSLENICYLRCNRSTAKKKRENQVRKYFECRLSGMTNVIIFTWDYREGNSFAHGVSFEGKKVPIKDAFEGVTELENLFIEKLKYLEALFTRIKVLIDSVEGTYFFTIDKNANPEEVEKDTIIFPDIAELLK